MSNILLISIIVLLIFFIAVLWFLRAPKLDPSIPHKPVHWLLGHLKEWNANEDNLYDWWVSLGTYFDDKTCAITLPGIRIILLMKPECVKHMFVKNGDNYIKGQTFNDCFEELLGDGIFNVDGKLWHRQRKVASRMFSLRQLRDRFVEIFTKHIETLIQVLDDVKPGDFIDLQKLFFNYTFDAFCEIGFGYNPEALLHDHPFCAAFDRANVICSNRFETPSLIWKTKRTLGIGDERELKKCLAIINSTVDKIMKERMEKYKFNDATSPKKNMINIMDLFINDSKKNGSKISSKELHDVIMNFVIAGRDTTAWACTALTYLLLKHPQEEAKLDLEARDRITGKTPTYQEAMELKLLDAAVMEALRLYPSVPADGKFAVHDDTMPDGTPIHAGDMVCYSAYMLGHSKKLWGENAKEFFPSRWLKKDFNPSEYKYPVFNVAPRGCLGKTMAMTEAKIVMSSLLKRYQFKLAKKMEPIQFGLGATLSFKTGLFVTVTKRKLFEDGS